jgi:hypothetical protein
VRPAFYALEPGGWRDYVTLLHPPYTLWHLGYAAIGAALAPELELDRLGWTLAAFALAMGVGAHALDELKGRPLQTRIPGPVLVALAAASLAGAVAVGVLAARWWTPWLLAFVAFGAFIVPAYNLELPGFHNALWFALAWGAFPVLTGYFAQAETIRAETVLAAAGAAVLSHGQHVLSLPVRAVRRRGLEPASLMEAPEAALRLLSVAVVLIAAALVVARLT